MPGPMTPSLKEIYQIGVSFRGASACERKHLSLSGEQARELHAAISARIVAAEFCLLSTCNRTEFYLFAPSTPQTLVALQELLGQRCPHLNDLGTQGKVDTRQGGHAYRHLLRVVCGLDSLVLGDTQIIQQIRQALLMARDCGSSGAYLERAFGGALRLGSRVRSETDISAGSAGVAAAVCDTIAAWQAANPSTSSPSILLLGAGAISSGVAKLLTSRGAGCLTVINRSLDRARQLADKCEASFLPWSEMSSAIARAEIVVAATAASSAVVDCELLKSLDAQLAGNDRKLIIDAGMPPNVETVSLNRIDVIGIDHLRERQDLHLQRRRAAIPMIDQMIETELQTWTGWLIQQPLERLLKSLYLDLAEVPHRLASRVGDSITGPADQLHYMIHREIKQLLHPHVHDLRRMIRNHPNHHASITTTPESPTL